MASEKNMYKEIESAEERMMVLRDRYPDYPVLIRAKDKTVETTLEKVWIAVACGGHLIIDLMDVM